MNQRVTDIRMVKWTATIRNLWPIIISILVLAAAFGYKKKEVEALEKSMEHNDTEHITLDQHRIEDQIHFATLDQIVREIPDMKKDIKSILREMRK